MPGRRRDRRPEAVQRRARRRSAVRLVLAVALVATAACVIVIGLDRLLGP